MPRLLPLRLATALAALALCLTIAPRAHAQGYPGGRGDREPGGMAGRRDGMERRRGGEDAAKRFSDMGSLKQVLKHVDDLSKEQKDSLKRIEKRYDENFEGYGREAKALFGGDSGGRPDMEAFRRLREDARNLRAQELGEARAVLTTDAQRAAFDANVKRLEDEAATREQEMRDRRRPAEPPRQAVTPSALGSATAAR